MKTISSSFMGLMCAALAFQSQITTAQSLEVLTFTGAEPLILTASQSAFASAMAVAGAIKIAQELSEPLENYEVDLKKWRGSTYTQSRSPYGAVQALTRIMSYDYNPDTRVAYYQDVRLLSVVDEQGQYYSDQTVYYDPFPFHNDNAYRSHVY
jgi:hypothetical protein